MLTDEELNAIEARANAATPGPWNPLKPLLLITTQSIEDDGLGAVMETIGLMVGQTDGVCIVCAECLDHADMEADALWDDAAFIAHAREDVPRLVAEVRALRERLALAEQVCREVLETWVHERVWSLYCWFCEARAGDVAYIEHEPGCPVLLARRVVVGEG